ncbi:CTP-phosphoethanolamine cytidylyltransferase isoform A [Chlorella sorokiniana]|uniref:acetyl-CoA carboxytransferase n=1 Tax=Chlorella sorokiniana TaxID=3076 RepID=A0A2P6TJE7_CHLSO|nr:CTP-phosphoethanolamine cytidylyltransferase isoform A [Chlorella sorokiniana]|eukprot:PRW39371.1 CTP-phosphoethanolamine cytidylyltransferase isoform A [Chlorella sorokiniana]
MHYGHANALRQAKALGDELVVGLVPDSEILRCKGPPILSDAERLKLVESVKWVDEVLTDVPYDLTPEFLHELFTKHRIDYVLHGDDPCLLPDGTDAYAHAKKLGRFKMIKRTEGVSTTDIVGRMLMCSRDNARFSAEDKERLTLEFSMGNGDTDSDTEPGTPATSRHTTVSRFMPTSRRIVQFSSGKSAPAGARIVYIDGAFDLFHVGHVEILKKAKQAGDFLLVGIHTDEDVTERRGPHLPIMGLHERALSVLSCRYVDEVVIGAPMVITEDLLTTFNISLVVTGTVHETGRGQDNEALRYGVPKAKAIFKVLDSPEAMTSAKLIERIVANRAQFEQRQAKKVKSEAAYYTTSKTFLQELCLGAAAAALAQPVSLTEQQRRLPARNGRALRPAALRPARLSVVAQAGKGKADPPDVPKPREGGVRQGGREWLQSILSRFGPVKEKASNTTVLDFEKPLVELDNRIKEVRQVAEENGVDVSSQIKELEERAKQLRKDTYSRLTPIQRLQVARHPNRPTFLDIALNISDKFVELHGDRGGLDDPAMVCGIGSIEGTSFMFIGHQKGRNTKENIYRNFGMPQPNGYRKALRFMRHADKFGLPIITFVDTPGAYAGKAAEELGQGEAIAVNLREMFGLRVPIISVVIGEGGSGGALAIGCANRNLIMENSVYYVASPEACAAILWKSRDKAGTATEALRITPDDLLRFGVMDEKIPEPLGAAHTDPMGAFPAIRKAILDNWRRYERMTAEEIQLDRYKKFRTLGLWEEFLVAGGKNKEAREALEKAAGATTKAGTWAPTEDDAKFIEMMADMEEKWQQTLLTKQEWVNKPQIPQGVTQAGLLELAAAAVESRRRLASGSDAAVDASSAAAADKSSPNGSTTLVNAETS